MALSTSDIKIIVDAETAKASKEIKRLTKELDAMNKKIAKGGRANAGEIGQMTRSFKSLTTHVSKLAIIYGSFKALISSTVITAQFEQSIKKLGVYSGTTAEELAQLEERAKMLGESTIFSASQVAEGMNEMALAGLEANQMLDGIDDILNLASVGMIDLKTATDFAVTSMKAFGLESTDINDIVDIFAKTSTISATNVTQLGQAMTKVGQVANTYNISLEETSTALGILADAGRRGSEAGTQLKIVMQRLAGNKEAKKYLDELGISIYDITTGKILPFAQQLANVRDRLKDLSEVERNIKLGQIFGSEASASAIALINSLEKYEDKLKQVREAMENDFATKSATAIVDTLVGSFKNLTSALEGLAIKIVSEMTPALRSMLDDTTEMIRGLDEDKIEDFANAIAGFGEALGGVLGVLYDVTSGVTSFARENENLIRIMAEAYIAFRLLTFTGLGNLAGALIASTAGATKFSKVLKALPALLKVIRAEMLLLLANPIVLAIAGLTTLAVTTAMYVDSLENEEKALVKNAQLMNDRTEQVNKMSEAYVNAVNKETGAIGANNAERGRLANNISDLIAKLTKQRDTMEQGNLTSEQYASTKKRITEQINNLYKMLDKIGDSWKEEAKAVAESTKQTKLLQGATAVAQENYKKWDKVLDKRLKKTQDVLKKLNKEEAKHNKEVEKLQKEKLDIIKDYADKRANLNQDYDRLLYDGRTKDLSEHKKYVQDKARAYELITKAQEAFEKGNIEEAQRYYSEAKSLATSFSGTVISENDKQLESSKITFKEAEKIYKLTKQGETEVLEAKKQAELDANAEKMKLVRIELQAGKAQLEMYKAHAQAIGNLGTAWSKRVKEFDDVGTFKTATEEFEKLENLIENSDTTFKPTLETETLETDFQKQIESMKDRYIPKFKYNLEVDESSLNTEVDKIERDPINPPLEPELEKDYLEKIQADIDKGKYSTDVDLNLDDEALSNVEKEIAKADLTADLDLNEEPALVKTRDLVAYVDDQKAQITTDSYNNPAYAGIDAVVRYGNSQKIVIPVHTQQVASTGGLIAPIQRLAEGGAFTGSGRVAGYDPTDSDKVSAMLTGGEYVIKREAVDNVGLGVLHAINNMQKPKGYATGGEVGGASTTLQPINLNIGGKSFAVTSDEQVANALKRYIEAEGGL